MLQLSRRHWLQRVESDGDQLTVCRSSQRQSRSAFFSSSAVVVVVVASPSTLDGLTSLTGGRHLICTGQAGCQHNAASTWNERTSTRWPRSATTLPLHPYSCSANVSPRNGHSTTGVTQLMDSHERWTDRSNNYNRRP